MKLYQKIIHKTRYARWINEKKRREKLNETVGRFFDFAENRLKQKNDFDLGPYRQELEESVLNMDTMPSMRALMTAGPALERDNIAGYNCAFLPIDNPVAFSELLYILMNGTGVGYSVESRHTNKLPEVPEELHDTDTVIVVRDSKMGWAIAIKELVSMLYAGQRPEWDLRKVREAGAVLRTFGGRASGPLPLDDCMRFITKTFMEARGRKLTPLECHDISCKIGEIVVVGGVRRSALISLFDKDDHDMQRAKSGAWYEAHGHRALANNSEVHLVKPSVSAFMKDWLALIDSRSGEPGIHNVYATEKHIEKHCPLRELIDSDGKLLASGANPCIAAGMNILTADGYKQIQDVVGDDVKLVDNTGNVVNGRVWYTGDKETIKLKFLSAEIDPIILTPDHMCLTNTGDAVKAQDMPGRRLKRFSVIRKDFDNERDFLAGVILGNGILVDPEDRSNEDVSITVKCKKDKEIINLYEDELIGYNICSRKNTEICQSHKIPFKEEGERGLPESIQNPDGLMGLYSAKGGLLSNGVALHTFEQEQAEKVIEVLATMGIEARIFVQQPRKTVKGVLYTMRKRWDVIISKYSSITVFAKKIGFIQKDNQDRLTKYLNDFAPLVSSISKSGVRHVYDFEIPTTHWGVVEGCVVHNCHEIALRPFQFCNLSMVTIRPTDTPDVIRDRVRIATILGTIQATFTDFKFLRKAWQRTTEEEALLGVTLTGVQDNPYTNMQAMRDDPEAMAALLESLKEVSIETNRIWAERIGINQSVSVTALKPSGNSGALVGTSSGLHAAYAPYYIRRITQATNDPITKFMIDQGFPHEVSKSYGNSVLFSFPMKSAETAICEKDFTAVEAVDYYLMWQRHYTTHMPSCTVHVRDDEWLDVGAKVYKHFDEIMGISFFPKDDSVYVQAPYEECDQKTYDELLTKMPETVDWSELSKYEESDYTVASQELACTGGKCEI